MVVFWLVGTVDYKPQNMFITILLQLCSVKNYIWKYLYLYLYINLGRKPVSHWKERDTEVRDIAFHITPVRNDTPV